MMTIIDALIDLDEDTIRIDLTRLILSNLFAPFYDDDDFPGNVQWSSWSETVLFKQLFPIE